MKKMLAGSMALCTMGSALAAQCDFTPSPDQFAYGFTGYGFPDKSYVVENNTFSDFELASESGKLLGATINIKTASVDTSADPGNWDKSGEWPEATILVRNQNIATGLFGNFVDGESIKAEIAEIDGEKVVLAVTMNGVTQNIDMPYTVADGVFNAKGTLDLVDFDTAEAMEKFAAICSAAWHQGKTWTDVDIYFSVPVAESACE
ncbi:YceI family protein [Suttonella sp. R2A3]|uniref:YceI family protein n=1 Tax=Suttonella sp. R2A3 TaxID=2908648 RepID=UPI001F3E33F0|nr:YceI family protein [Suttonella sp. R2A3]UJF24427.1 YceI family protein [Suttonella sp. R2A3]